MDDLAQLTTEEKETILDDVIQSLGMTAVKQHQKDAILHIVSGKDVLVALPTGYGKSIIYGCLPRLFDRSLIVRGPL